MIGPITRRQLLVGAAILSGKLLQACASPASVPRAPTTAPAFRATRALTFMAGYKPQANISFVGVYVAHDLGYFKEQRLDVDIKHSSGQGEHAKLLAAKQVQVITEIASSIVKNVTGEGVPFVSLAVLSQRGDSALATLKSSGIAEPRQFEGKTVGYKAYPTYEYVALLKAAGVDRSKIREVPVGFDVRVLTEGKVDVLPVLKSNEPDLLHQLGFEVNVIDPVSYGVQSMGQIWSTHRELLAADPDLFERFTKAALRGLYYAFDHLAEAIDIVMRYAPKEDRQHQEHMLATEKQSAITDQTRRFGLGWQTLEQWSALQDAMAEFGFIKSKVDPAIFFADRIQRTIYRNGQLTWP